MDLIWVRFWALDRVTPLHDALSALPPTLKHKFTHKKIKKIFLQMHDNFLVVNSSAHRCQPVGLFFAFTFVKMKGPNKTP